jgi:hypothetical protein
VFCKPLHNIIQHSKFLLLSGLFIYEFTFLDVLSRLVLACENRDGAITPWLVLKAEERAGTLGKVKEDDGDPLSELGEDIS